MSEHRSNGGGISFTGLLTVVLITLKLLGKIDWSWWWVWSPVLISTGIFLLFVFITLLAIFVKEVLK